jgi:hypothetical protein
MIYKAEDFDVRQTAQRSDGYPCVTVVPPGSMPMFEMTAGHALVLAAQLEAAAKRAMESAA